jgi:hypothetical protein
MNAEVGSSFVPGVTRIGGPGSGPRALPARIEDRLAETPLRSSVRRCADTPTVQPMRARRARLVGREKIEPSGDIVRHRMMQVLATADEKG